MTSFSHRYLHGDHEGVWRDLRSLGPVPAALRDDVRQVATATMRRVARHVARLATALPELGFVAAVDIPMHRPPTEDDRGDLDALADEIGGLPAALHACLSEVGLVCFLGDWADINLHYHEEAPSTAMPPGPDYPDPLCLPNVATLRMEWDEHPGGGFAFPFAPDELHKTNVSGGTHDIALPDQRADPVLLGVAGRPNITLVDYLRESIAWAGFPGWSFSPTPPPATLTRLTTTPDF